MLERTHGYVMIVNAFDNTMKIGRRRDVGRRAGIAHHGRATRSRGSLEASDAIFGLSSLPFTVQSIETSKAANARARRLYEDALRTKGLKLLYITLWPPTGLSVGSAGLYPG